jgi:predicted Rossmann-fold nucleotide-binding protein
MPTDKRPLKVFLCHAHADRDAVRALYKRLTNDGVDAWLDKEKLLPGQNWELEIKKAVREADVVMVCLSKQFNQAGFRQKEVRLALDTAMEKPEGEIFIIPARLEECENLESLRKWHWVDLFEEDGHEMLIRALHVRAEKIGALDLSIKPALISSEEIAPIKNIAMPLLKIMVTGGRVVARGVATTAFYIGSQAINRGHVLINNGSSGVDRASAEGALNACKEKLLSPEDLIKVYRPAEEPTADFHFGDLHIVGKTYNQRRDYVLGICDVVIVLGGGAGTRKLINHALSIGKPLIPIGIGDSTEAAFDTWQKMFTGFIESPIEIEDLKKIGHKQNQDKEILAVNALVLAEGLTGR